MRKNKVGAQKVGFSILALDDDPIMTATLQAYFTTSGYTVDVETDPDAAIELIRENHYDILLLDFLLTSVTGDRVISRIRDFDHDIFIILLTGHKSMAPPIRAIRELDIQGYYEKNDRFDQLELLIESCVKSIKQMRTIRAMRDDLDRKNKQLTQMYASLGDSYIEVISALRLVVDARDIYTRGHSDRVSYYATLIAEELGRDEGFTERVRVAGLFHDVGKIAISDSVLLKPGRLTDAEYGEIKRHSDKGAEILSAISAFTDISRIVRMHHERYDGRGYPDGVAGEDILEEARIISVADSYDAMTSHRLYRENMQLSDAKEQLISCSGTQFDPVAVKAFLSILESDRDIDKAIEWTYSSHIEAGML